MDLNGVALITGAGSGIGRDCGLAFASAGAQAVAFADLDLGAAEAAAEESKAHATQSTYQAMAIQVDVSDEASVVRMVQEVRDTLGRIDYSVNSAGIGVRTPRPVYDMDMAEFERFHAVNVRGLMLCVRHVSAAMRVQDRRIMTGRNGPRDVGRGSIVNVASANSFVAMPEIVQYTSAKHAVVGITKTAALDLASDGVRVNAICPSWVETPMVDQAFAGNPDILRSLADGIPAGRIASVEEVSDVIMFLSGSGASYVTGAGWLVDGGTTLRMKVA